MSNKSRSNDSEDNDTRRLDEAIRAAGGTKSPIQIARETGFDAGRVEQRMRWLMYGR